MLKNLGNLVRYGALAALVGGMTVPAMADLVTNGNFAGQSPGTQYTTISSGSTFAGDWTVGNTGNVDWIGNYWQSPTGVAGPLNGSVDLDGTSPGAISQSITTVAGAVYVLTFSLSGNPDNTSEPVKFLTVDAAGTGESYKYDTTGNTHTSMNYIPESFMFTATSNSTIISFISTDAAGSDWGPVVGGIGVNLAPTTPEPGFYGALAIGLSGLFYLVRRRQNA
jgi:choice-of-anchor C domain-containing protein